MHLVVDADAGLVSLQCVGEAADLQHQQVDRLQHLLAVNHAVGQTLQLAVADRAREGAREAHSISSVMKDITANKCMEIHKGLLFNVLKCLCSIDFNIT